MVKQQTDVNNLTDKVNTDTDGQKSTNHQSNINP